ncbi:MAG: TonB-dependent receptor [Dysgonamonadaceae bacterium]|jgi:outer membrane receptor for ferrienterochelin and colicins|nr:TonB-dependent receptor [Dysgonamonadaceae bacterium]
MIIKKLLFFISALYISLHLQAQQQTETMPQQSTQKSDATTDNEEKKLEEVVVTGTRTVKRLSETPVLTTVIREKEIRESASVSALESLQDNIPGIVSSPNAMGNNLRIRGLNSRYILFLVDGERLVSEGAGGNLNLDQIDVNNIRQIEMVNGASSALYGSNAVGSVINIISKEPVHRIETTLNQSIENYNTLRTRLDVGSAQGKFSTRAGAFRNSSDGFGDNGGAYAARYEDYGANLKLGFKPSQRSDINIISRYFSHETFNPENTLNVKHSLTHNLTLGANGGIKSRDNTNSLRISANYDKYFDYYVLEKKKNKLDLHNSATYFSARIIDTYSALEKWEFVAGAEFNHEENFSTTTLGKTPTTKSLNDVNGFAQAQYKLNNNFDIVGGGRYTYNTQFGSSLTPKLSLMYNLKRLKFRTGIGSSFRSPSIKELYYDFDHSGMFWVYGNPDLKPEKGIYYSLSAEYTHKSLNFSVSGYHNNIDNKITQYDVIRMIGGTNKNEKYYKNVNSATIKGIDVCISYNFLKQLLLKANYSCCDAKDNSTGLQLESNVRHSETLSATWYGKVFKSPFSLQVAGRLNSPKLYQQMVTDSNGDALAELKSSKSYSIWKAVLVKSFKIKRHTMELTLKADNIFNFKEVSFINPGRQYLAGIRYLFN